jgi:hypothetical protein
MFILNYLSFTNMFLVYPIPTQVLGYLMIYKIIWAKLQKFNLNSKLVP